MSRGLAEILGALFGSRRRGDETRTGQGIKLTSGADPTGIYARTPSGSLLDSVLTAPMERPADQVAPSRKATAASASRTMGVGEALRRAREEVLVAGQELASISDATTAGYIRQFLALIEEQYCSIAFIGQMNAGKSSLINAFTGAPKFLPTEITPWTSVVTNLYFGIPKSPTRGVVFEFFSPEEWQQLAEGSSRVRALTAQLIPNFSWEDFYRQLGTMREAAERRLGPRYSELLGSRHAFPEATTPMLERYIAAESPLGGGDGEGPGAYSMLTKAAHVYFDLISFFYPTLVIDTPGVNDPLLVRDEITRQNLERANIFVIVVTARQPLSNADLDLLRILRGLNKDQIVVFVNKIDEIDDFPVHSTVILERIRALLKHEFPASDIPVIMGSAWWAEVALGDDLAAKRALIRTLDYGEGSEASLTEGVGSFWMPDAGAEQAMLTERILTRSGVPDLALAVSEILQKSASAASIQYTASVLATLARNGAARGKALAALSAAPPPADLGGRLYDAGGILEAVETAIGEAEAQTARLMATYKTALIADLLKSLHAGMAFRPDDEQKHPGGTAFQLTSLVVHLRSQIEQEFLRLFQQGLGDVTALAHETEAALRQQIALASEKLRLAIGYAELPALGGAPSLAALGQPVATDLSDLLAGHRADIPQPSPEQAAEVKALIEAEFAAIISTLAKSAEAEMRRAIAFALDHFRITIAHALKAAIAEQRGVLDRDEDAEMPIGVSHAAQIQGSIYQKLAEGLAATAGLIA